jgi:hypothetical protein
MSLKLTLYSILMVFNAVFNVAFAQDDQDLKKKDLFGMYSNSFGLPGRTVVDEHGGEIHIIPLEMRSSKLYLQKLGRFKLIESDHLLDFDFIYRGRWKLNQDTIVLSFKKKYGKKNYSFTFRAPVYLEAVGTHESFQKQSK